MEDWQVRARQLAGPAIENGEATAWFDRLYAAGRPARCRCPGTATSRRRCSATGPGASGSRAPTRQPSWSAAGSAPTRSTSRASASTPSGSTSPRPPSPRGERHAARGRLPGRRPPRPAGGVAPRLRPGCRGLHAPSAARPAARDAPERWPGSSRRAAGWWRSRSVPRGRRPLDGPPFALTRESIEAVATDGLQVAKAEGSRSTRRCAGGSPTTDESTARAESVTT